MRGNAVEPVCSRRNGVASPMPGDVVEEARWRGFVCDGVWVDLGCLGVGVSVVLFGVVVGASGHQ
jgi:hypothetical protein